MATRVQSHASALHSCLSSSLLTILCLGVLVWVPSLSGEEKDEKKPSIQPRVPGIFSIGPNGAHQGKTINVEILGDNLDGAGRLEFSGDGLEGKILRCSYLRCVAEVSVQPDAQAGIRSIRVISPHGTSNLLGFRIGELPHWGEAEPNDSRQEAQEVEWPAVVDAVLYPDGDTDHYRFHARAGERLMMEVLAARNGSGLNAELYLLDSSGRRLAVAEEQEPGGVGGGDPVLDYRFETEGDYFVVARRVLVRDHITFPTGHPAYTYQLKISSPPRLYGVLPFAAAPHSEVELNLLGESLESVQTLQLSRPGMAAKILERSAGSIRALLSIAENASGVYELWATSPGGSSERVRFLVADAAGAREVEPNDERNSGNRIPLPAAVEGVIGGKGDVDAYRVTVQEPGAYVFEIQAGRFNSLLDSVIELYDPKGKLLASNDDGFFPEGAQGDAKLEYSFAAPGEYVVEVRQAVLNLNGDRYYYRLIARPSRPHFLLAPGPAAGYPAVRGPDRVVVAQGSTIKIPVTVQWLEGLEGLGGDVQLTIEGLPPEIQVPHAWARVAGGKYTDTPPVFTAEVGVPIAIPADASVRSYPIRIHGEAVVQGKRLVASEQIRVTVRGLYAMAYSAGFSYTLDHHYLSVVKPPVFMLLPEIGDERYPVRFAIQRGTKKILALTVIPPEEFADNVQVTFENLPRGVTIDHVQPEPESHQYMLHLKAAADCEQGWFPMVNFTVATKRNGREVLVPTPFFGIAVR